jgi:hypothetical protein
MDRKTRATSSARRPAAAPDGGCTVHRTDAAVADGSRCSGEQWLYELKLSEPVRYSAPLDADLPVLNQAVKARGFEGLLAKQCTSVYAPGLRMGAWMKMRVNRGYGFVIGGYTRGTNTFDALIFRSTFLGGNGWVHLAVR